MDFHAGHPTPGGGKGRTPLQIITAHRGRVHAFFCLNGTTLGRLIQKCRPHPGFEAAWRIARAVCQAPELLPSLTHGATHFTRASERPYWPRGVRPVATIGHHAFYQLEHY
jgi:hypothetical protein